MHIVDASGLEHIGVPIRFADEPAAPRFALPAIGQHNAEVLQSIGYTPERIDALRGSGAIVG
jgi:crotonobetainyl-CoA:carnitine CoA-transferase CaiB-like acyl-CoA transferase